MTNAALMTTQQHESHQYLRCNTIGHAWFEYDNSDWKPQFGVDWLVLRCERCGSERRDTIGTQGQVIARKYKHPEGYKYAKGTRPSKQQFRRMLVEQRILEARKKRTQRKEKVKT